MGNFIAVTVMIPVINHSIGIDTTFFRALVQSITVVIYYYFCRITDQFLVANFPFISAGRCFFVFIEIEGRVPYKDAMQIHSAMRMTKEATAYH